MRRTTSEAGTATSAPAATPSADRLTTCPVSAPVREYADLLATGEPVAYVAADDRWHVLDPQVGRALLAGGALAARGYRDKTARVAVELRSDVELLERFLSEWLVFSDNTARHGLVKAALRRAMREDLVERVAAQAVRTSLTLPIDVGFGLVDDVAAPLARSVTRSLLHLSATETDVVDAASKAFMGYLAADGATGSTVAQARGHVAAVVGVALDRVRQASDPIARELGALYASGQVDDLALGATYAQLFTGSLEPLLTMITRCVQVGARRDCSTAEEWQQLIESELRLTPPFHFAPRRATRDLTVAGSNIPVGARVVVNLPAANMACSDARHLTFGHGVHYCLGARLTRVVLTRALPVLVPRVRDAGIAVSRPELAHGKGISGYHRAETGEGGGDDQLP